MNRLFTLLACAALPACMSEGPYRSYYGEPQIIGRSGNSVQVRAGFNVSPVATAEAACGGPAVLEKTEKTDQQGYYSVYYYRCS